MPDEGDALRSDLQNRLLHEVEAGKSLEQLREETLIPVGVIKRILGQGLKDLEQASTAGRLADLFLLNTSISGDEACVQVYGGSHEHGAKQHGCYVRQQLAAMRALYRKLNLPPRGVPKEKS